MLAIKPNQGNIVTSIYKIFNTMSPSFTYLTVVKIFFLHFIEKITNGLASQNKLSSHIPPPKSSVIPAVHLELLSSEY